MIPAHRFSPFNVVWQGLENGREQDTSAFISKEPRPRRSAKPAGDKIVGSLEFSGVEIGLNAAICAVVRNEPVVLVVHHGQGSDQHDALPFGPFAPKEHRTLEAGLRAWVKAQAGLELGYAEQLYTFGDRGRHARPGDMGPHVVSIGYLALRHETQIAAQGPGDWRSWYDYFPWEDWRKGKPHVLETVIGPRLAQWVSEPRAAEPMAQPISRADRLRLCFGLEGCDLRHPWDEEKVLERYELLYEAGLIQEARRDGRDAAKVWDVAAQLGRPMQFDHRRILATAIGRLRAKIKYRPVIFELMAPEFTLFELQQVVEAILGPHLHKQNFRRLVENGGLVVQTGEKKSKTGGRPAKLYRFRPEVILERPAPGVRVKPGRG